MILDMPQLAAHNPEIDQEKEEVKMIWCLPICGKRKQKTQGKRQVRKIKERKTVEELVSRKFWKWKKVFRKEELEKMPTRKLWDYAIELKEGFVPKKEKVYLLSREEKEEVQAFMKDQLRKGYIQPLKLPQTSLVHNIAKKNGKKRIVQDYCHINQ